jgi:hypothetical protein
MDPPSIVIGAVLSCPAAVPRGQQPFSHRLSLPGSPRAPRGSSQRVDGIPELGKPTTRAIAANRRLELEVITDPAGAALPCTHSWLSTRQRLG